MQRILKYRKDKSNWLYFNIMLMVFWRGGGRKYMEKSSPKSELCKCQRVICIENDGIEGAWVGYFVCAIPVLPCLFLNLLFKRREMQNCRTWDSNCVKPDLMTLGCYKLTLEMKSVAGSCVFPDDWIQESSWNELPYSAQYFWKDK